MQFSVIVKNQVPVSSSGRQITSHSFIHHINVMRFRTHLIKIQPRGTFCVPNLRSLPEKNFKMTQGCIPRYDRGDRPLAKYASLITYACLRKSDVFY